jgi:NAD-specific glutamate dehydrogenase
LHYCRTGDESNNHTPNFKYIVEGANLFITQIARLRLEKAGVVVFKDASANKGMPIIEFWKAIFM